MFRLIKLFSLIAFGYLFYEVVVKQKGSNRALKAPEPEQAHFEPTSPSNITGFSGEGRSVHVASAGGGYRSTKVGRGVLR